MAAAIAGLGITALYQVLRCQGLGTDDVLRTVQRQAPAAGLDTRHLSGRCADPPDAAALPDREGAALPNGRQHRLDIGSWEKQSPAGRRCAAVCRHGGAVLGAVRHTDGLGTLCSDRGAGGGQLWAPALAPSLVAALIASGVSSAAGIAPTAFRVVMPALTWQTALQAGLLGAGLAPS